MFKEIILPKQGLQMTEGTITKWIVPEGGDVKEGEPLFEMETDKLTITIDATASGKLLKIIRGEGETVPITEVIAYVGDEADRSKLPEGPSKAPAPSETKKEPEAAPPKEETKPETPKEEPKKDIAKEEDLKKISSKAGKTAIQAVTPRARTFAEMYNIDISKVNPTGPSGLVIARDVLAYKDRPANERLSYAVIKVSLKAIENCIESLSKTDPDATKEYVTAKIAQRAFEITGTFDSPDASDIFVKYFENLLISFNADAKVPSIMIGRKDENDIAPVTFIYTGEDEDADKFLGAFRKLIENPSLAFI